MKRKLLIGLTTTPGSNWREKTEEIGKYNLEEIALFPTFLKSNERKELYALLERTKLKRIPHVHLRDDMEKWEMDLFKKYQAEVFNIHPHQVDVDFIEKVGERDNIFVENCEIIDKLFIDIASQCGGICLDISHWEDEGLKNGYNKFGKIVEQFKIGCSHISAISSKSETYKHYHTNIDYEYFSSHWLNDLSELDYVKKYVNFLPKYVSIELENSFEEQLKIKEYLEKIIN